MKSKRKGLYLTLFVILPFFLSIVTPILRHVLRLGGIENPDVLFFPSIALCFLLLVRGGLFFFKKPYRWGKSLAAGLLLTLACAIVYLIVLLLVGIILAFAGKPGYDLM